MMQRYNLETQSLAVRLSIRPTAFITRKGINTIILISPCNGSTSYTGGKRE